jgi:hypothetical protein
VLFLAVRSCLRMHGKADCNRNRNRLVVRWFGGRCGVMLVLGREDVLQRRQDLRHRGYRERDKGQRCEHDRQACDRNGETIVVLDVVQAECQLTKHNFRSLVRDSLWSPKPTVADLADKRGNRLD